MRRALRSRPQHHADHRAVDDAIRFRRVGEAAGGGPARGAKRLNQRELGWIRNGGRPNTSPRVNLPGFWLVPVSILLYYGAFFTGGALDAGGTGYAPLTEKAYQGHSLGVDFWALSIIVWAISGIMASTNFLTTIVALRAPGMKLTRLPLFVWAQISTSILLLVVVAPLAAAMILVEFDRQLGTQFFTTPARRQLSQHPFWFFGHPQASIMILPPFGMTTP